MFFFVVIDENYAFVCLRIKEQSAYGLSVVIVYEYGKICLCISVCYSFYGNNFVKYRLDNVECLKLFFGCYYFTFIVGFLLGIFFFVFVGSFNFYCFFLFYRRFEPV